jgi:teichuronic acid biosynthesis glycosyltransferase TuaC
VKNFPLANTAFNLLKAHYPNAELLELRGYSRSEVNLLMNAVDVLLVTSFTESGPLVVKEAMACNLPIVCTDVGDVQGITRGIPGIYITSYDADDISEKLKLALCFNGRTGARCRALQFENRLVASKIKNVYSKVIERNHFKSPGHTVSDDENTLKLNG